MRKLIIFLIVLGILGITAYGGRRGYRVWKTQRAVQHAHEALAESDHNKALLWLRKALEGNANNIEAVRMMGDFAEAAQAPNAVFWRERLVKLEPNSLTNRLLLARAGMFHREYDVAKKALDEVDDAGKKTAEYCKSLGGLALATGQYAEAEKNFAEAMKLQPDNPIPQLTLAMLRIARTNVQAAAEGRQMLEGLRTNAAVRPEALRQLTVDAVRHTNYPRALALSNELVQETNSVFNDRLVHLDVLRAAKSPQFQPTLSALQQQAATNAPRVFDLSRWMLAARGPHETLGWLQTVPPEIRTNFPVTIAVADGYLGSTNWAGLQAYVSKQNWGELEYLRLSFSARALREQNLNTASKADWSKAFKAAEGRLDRLLALERLAAAWNWPTELEEVLWSIVNKFPAQKGEIQTLGTLLYITGKTRSLLTLFAQQMKTDPKDFDAKNNLASIALLLSAEEHKPHELAREVYEKQKNNPAYASTYAYSLHLQKKTAEALQVMDQLKPEQLDQPSMAGYYGLMLAASGDKAKAKRYMELAAKGRLLPEERELIERAKL